MAGSLMRKELTVNDYNDYAESLGTFRKKGDWSTEEQRVKIHDIAVRKDVPVYLVPASAFKLLFDDPDLVNRLENMLPEPARHVCRCDCGSEWSA
jgi:hypothetical protein